jgi:precorrin-2 dehydrogenase/sirohydrochlorin ferrochelatase
MSYLVNLDLRDRPALVVGAGEVAARKIAALVRAGARVTVVAVQASEAVLALARHGHVVLDERAFAPGDARGAVLVIGATNDDEVNRRVAADAWAFGALVNIVDRPELCTFTVPAVVHRGDLTLAASTEGRCPSLARVVRERLERQYGPEWSDVVARVAQLRQRLMREGWPPSRIQAAVSRVVEAGLVEAIACGDKARIASALATATTPAQAGGDVADP